MLIELIEKYGIASSKIIHWRRMAHPIKPRYDVSNQWSSIHSRCFPDMHPMEFNTLLEYVSQSDNRLIYEQFKRLLSIAKLSIGTNLDTVHRKIQENQERYEAEYQNYKTNEDVINQYISDENIVSTECRKYWDNLIQSLILGYPKDVDEEEFYQLQQYLLIEGKTIASIQFFDKNTVLKICRWMEHNKVKPIVIEMETTENAENVAGHKWSDASKKIFERHRKAGSIS